MLRITDVNEATGLTLRLEGRLIGPWVDEVRKATTAHQAGVNGRPVRLDMRAVAFVDGAGVELLRELRGQGVELMSCSSFVAELLHAGNA